MFGWKKPCGNLHCVGGMMAGLFASCFIRAIADADMHGKCINKLLYKICPSHLWWLGGVVIGELHGDREEA